MMYLLIRHDRERNVNTFELYRNMLDAKEEMWNKIHFQRRIRDGLLIEMVDSNYIILTEQKEIDGDVHEVLAYSIEELVVH